MRYLRIVAVMLFPMCLSPGVASANDPKTALKSGGYVLVIRHTATDDSQKDVYPFRYDDMKLQRQLSEKGRAAASEIGADMKKLGLPIGVVYTSRLNRAVETGRLISGKDVQPRDELTDSGAGSASSMANPSGTNAKAGAAIRTLANNAPPSGANNLLITHKTNVADGFGKDLADIGEGEALVLKPDASGSPKLIGRIKASDWR